MEHNANRRNDVTSADREVTQKKGKKLCGRQLFLCFPRLLPLASRGGHSFGKLDATQ